MYYWPNVSCEDTFSLSWLHSIFFFFLPLYDFNWDKVAVHKKTVKKWECMLDVWSINHVDLSRAVIIRFSHWSLSSCPFDCVIIFHFLLKEHLSDYWNVMVFLGYLAESNSWWLDALWWGWQTYVTCFT